MSTPIPFYRGDRSYYGRKHPNGAAHLREIEIGEIIDNRIEAGIADASYSVVITRKEIDA